MQLVLFVALLAAAAGLPRVCADANLAAKIKGNLARQTAAPEAAAAVARAADGWGLQQLSPAQFASLYEENKDLWGDCTPQDAYVNLARSHTGNVDSARLLLEFSLVPSVKSALDRFEWMGMTGWADECVFVSSSGGGSQLHQAAAAGNLAAVERWLDTQAGTVAMVDTAKGDGTTALIIAATMGHAKVAERLLEEGASTEAAGSNGATAMHVGLCKVPSGLPMGRHR
jgi:hypothetical protein